MLPCVLELWLKMVSTINSALHFMIIYINVKIAVILLQISKVSPGTLLTAISKYKPQAHYPYF